MNCDCSIDVGDYEPTKMLRQGRFRAKKARRCCECGKVIPRGGEYWMQHVTSKPGHEVYYTCIPCYSIRMNYCSGGYVFTELADQIKECLGFDYREVPEKDEEEE